MQQTKEITKGIFMSNFFLFDITSKFFCHQHFILSRFHKCDQFLMCQDINDLGQILITGFVVEFYGAIYYVRNQIFISRIDSILMGVRSTLLRELSLHLFSLYTTFQVFINNSHLHSKYISIFSNKINYKLFYKLLHTEDN